MGLETGDSCQALTDVQAPDAYPRRLVWSFVSVRILHGFPRVHCRSISGSLLHWRISGGSETFPE
jgi:hypothetical protein